MTQNRDVIRRRYAEATLTGLLSGQDMTQHTPQFIASVAFQIADAMLEEEDKYCAGKRVHD